MARLLAPLARAPWTLLVTLAAVTATAAWAGDLGSVGSTAVEPLLGTRAWAQPWRLLTGGLVHSDWELLLRDLPIFAALAFAVERKARAFVGLLALALAAPAAAVLATQSGVEVFGGLSGAINALVVVFVAQRWRDAAGWGRVAVGLLGTLHGSKVLYEGLTGQLVFPMEIAGGAPAPLAHLVGAVVGLLWVAGRAVSPTTPTPETVTPAAPSAPSLRRAASGAPGTCRRSPAAASAARP